MRSIATSVVYTKDAEQALKFYQSVFPELRVLEEFTVQGGGPDGTMAVYLCRFELFGQRFEIFNGGDHFSFTDAFSISVRCDTQEEIDATWDALIDGGTPSVCGWLTDRFGVSWQINSANVDRKLADATPEQQRNVMKAMGGMQRLDIAELERAFGES